MGVILFSVSFYFSNIKKMINKILDIFQTYRMAPTKDDVYETQGKQILAEKMEIYVSQNKTIPFVMLGFPFKSTNSRDKVLGKLPDYAEELTLKNFAKFNEDVKMVYEPGIEINMVSDGFVFNDLLGATDRDVEIYKEISMDMGKVASVKWFDLKDFYGTSLNTGREKVISHFGITPEKLANDILNNPDVNYLYRGMIRFMEEELAIKDFPSRNQLQKAAKKLTREMMFRNEAYSNLVRKEFSSHIRLSMHPSVNNGAKYSINLINGRSHYSAWHSVVLEDEDGFMTMHKKDAIEAGHELMYKNNQPFYFKKNN